MKWFKHDSDMHTDLKVQNLVDNFGIEGYAIFNLCLELVAKEGVDGRIMASLGWRQAILKVARWSDEGKLDNILKHMGKISLICPKSLRYGHLYIPKLMERADEYTQRKIGRMSGQYRDNIGAKNTTEEIRKEEKRRGNFSYLSSKNLKELKTDFKGDIASVKNFLLGAGLPEAAVVEALEKEKFLGTEAK